MEWKKKNKKENEGNINGMKEEKENQSKEVYIEWEK
jgi:hypothetical protein